MEIRPLSSSDFFPELLVDFHHEQNWTQQWVNTDAGWQLQPLAGSRRWDAEKRRWIVCYLQAQLERGGAVFGAFSGSHLIGFVAIDGIVTDGYADLTMLFVEDDRKREGIGRALFRQAVASAKGLGAQKLFIPAIPSAETVAFYTAMGCRDAQAVIPAFVDSDKDRWMELLI